MICHFVSPVACCERETLRRLTPNRHERAVLYARHRHWRNSGTKTVQSETAISIKGHWINGEEKQIPNKFKRTIKYGIRNGAASFWPIDGLRDSPYAIMLGWPLNASCYSQYDVLYVRCTSPQKLHTFGLATYGQLVFPTRIRISFFFSFFFFINFVGARMLPCCCMNYAINGIHELN